MVPPPPSTEPSRTRVGAKGEEVARRAPAATNGTGSSTSIAGSTDNQGTIAATGGGAISFGAPVNNSGQIIAQGTGSSITATGGITNSGTIATMGGGAATINGTITNTGTINTSQGGGSISATGAIGRRGRIAV